MARPPLQTQIDRLSARIDMFPVNSPTIDPTHQPDGAWLKTSGGIAVWVPTPAVEETDLEFSDVATANASTSKHGLLPKLPGLTTEFFRADGAYAQVDESALSLSDVTTDNVSTARHGFVPKAPNDATKVFLGTGVFGSPPGSTVRTLNIVLNGNGAALTAAIVGDVEIDFACTIVEWSLLADVSGSLVVDVWKDVYANYPPTVADSITAAAKPTLSSQQNNQSSTLTGWTTAISAGDILRFHIDSAATITRATLALKLQT